MYVFKSTGSNCPSLWEHFRFTLLGKQHIHKAHSTPLVLEFTLLPASLRKQKHRLPQHSRLCLLSCAVSMLTPLPGQTLPVLSPQGHGPSKRPLSLAHQFLPVPLPDHSHQLTRPCGHIIYLHTHTHTFILTLTCIPGFHSISVPFYGKTPLKWFISAAPCHPPPPFSARSETTLFPNTRVNTCLFLPDLSRAHHALQKACSSLSFQVNSPLVPLLPRRRLLPKSF